MRVISVALLSTLLVGCNRVEQQSTLDLRNEVKMLQTQVNDLSARVTENRMQVVREQMRGPGESVEFDPRETNGYSQVLSPVGTLLVKLQKVEPYLDGYTITFLVGNPSGARLSGVTGSVKWGEEIDWNDVKSFDRVQEKKFDLPVEFQAGAWSAVKLNVGPAKPEQMRRLIFAPVFNSLVLRAPPAQPNQ